MTKRYSRKRIAAFLIFLITAAAVSFFRISFVCKFFLWLILGESAFFIDRIINNGIHQILHNGLGTRKRSFFVVFLILISLVLLIMCLITDGGYPVFRDVIILSVLAGMEGCLIAFFLWFSNDQSIVRTVGILMIVFGSIFMMILPFGIVPDEAMHLYTAYHVSDQILHTVSSDSQKTIMRVMDIKYNLTETEYDDAKMEAYFSEFDSQKWNFTLKEEKVPLVAGSDYLYVVPALGISLGRICHLNSLQTFLLGRMFNLILSVICICAAVHIIPFGKMVLLVMSLMPMTLQQAMSYSYDAPINAMFFLFIALVMAWFYSSEKHSGGRFVLMVLLAVLTAMGKSHAYVMVSLLPLFLWSRKKMKNLQEKTKLLIASGAVVLVLGALAGCFLAARRLPPVILEPDDHYSLVFLLQNPGEIVNIAYQTIIQKGSLYLDTMVGMYLGYLNLKISPLIIYLIYLMVVIAAVKNKDEKEYLNWGDRILFLITGLVTTGFVLAGMLLANSRYSDHMVTGMQGRYLLPVVMLCLFCIRNKHIQKDHIMDYYVLCGELITLLLIVCNLIAIV